MVETTKNKALKKQRTFTGWFSFDIDVIKSDRL